MRLTYIMWRYRAVLFLPTFTPQADDSMYRSVAYGDDNVDIDLVAYGPVPLPPSPPPTFSRHPPYRYHSWHWWRPTWTAGRAGGRHWWLTKLCRRIILVTSGGGIYDNSLFNILWSFPSNDSGSVWLILVCILLTWLVPSIQYDVQPFSVCANADIVSVLW